MSESTAAWNLIPVSSPTLARTAGGHSPLHHADWVRLFLGRSFARARVAGASGAPTAVEYLVTGTEVSRLDRPDDALLREASDAIATCFNGLQGLLEFHRKRIRTAHEAFNSGGSVPGVSLAGYELLLQSYPLLMCVTVSDSPDDWLATDEGLCIVRWGLQGVGHRPLLQWSDSDLALMRRRVFERARLRDGGGGISADLVQARGAAEEVGGAPVTASPSTKAPGVTSSQVGRTNMGGSSLASVHALPIPGTERARLRARRERAVWSALLLVVSVLASWAFLQRRPESNPVTKDSDAQPANSAGSSLPGTPSNPLPITTGASKPPEATGSAAAQGSGSNDLVPRSRLNDEEGSRLKAEMQRDRYRSDLASVQSAWAEAYRWRFIDHDGPVRQIRALDPQLLLVFLATWLGTNGDGEPQSLKSAAERVGIHTSLELRRRVGELVLSGGDLGDQAVRGLGAKWKRRASLTQTAWQFEPVRVDFPEGVNHDPLESGRWHWVGTAEATKWRERLNKSQKKSFQDLGNGLLTMFPESGGMRKDVGVIVVDLPGADGSRISKIRSELERLTSTGGDPSWRDVLGFLSSLPEHFALKQRTRSGGAPSAAGLFIPADLVKDMLLGLVKDVQECGVPSQFPGSPELRRGFDIFVEDLDPSRSNSQRARSPADQMEFWTARLEALSPKSLRTLLAQRVQSPVFLGVLDDSGDSPKLVGPMTPVAPPGDGVLQLVVDATSPPAPIGRWTKQGATFDRLSDLPARPGGYLGCAIIWKPDPPAGATAPPVKK
jgi:hypothetical protein